ncbi:MAG TPA: TonB-dependent receptor [Rhizomicrobium sp.]|nr:TonB-dependent receptor [Rhizomicrobium sp.]
MPGYWKTRTAALASAAICALATPANATDFNIPGGDLKSALDAYSRQAGISLLYPVDEVKGIPTKGVQGDLTSTEALTKILNGTGFRMNRHGDSAVTIVRDPMKSSGVNIEPMQMAQATPARAAVETVTVTSSKLGGADVQSIPISITALSQEQLTATQTAGGPDLVKQVPNLTFTKTNFSGYSIQIRGIGTQAISVTTDPAVAVALNDIPFIRNHFFEQEFYDLSQAEVLRGPQGTLYGRNATAGVVNLITAKPSDQFEAMASGEIGSYHQRRFEGMINLPLVDDRLDVRLAGEWTKRQGYSFNELTDQRIDGRDLWSGRLSIGWKPIEDMQVNLVWEHFSEDDDRMRTAKQLCKTDPGLTQVDGIPVFTGGAVQAYAAGNFLSQGCIPTSLYSNDAFQVPNGASLPYYEPLNGKGAPITAADFRFDPYASTVQSHNLRVIETTLDPVYKVKNDIVELNAEYKLTPALTVTSQTGYDQDFLWSTEDYNRFNTAPGAFLPSAPNQPGLLTPDPGGQGVCTEVFGNCLAQGDPCPDPGTSGCHAYGVFCDPQLGCSNRLVAQDLSEERAWQVSQEFRLASNFSGPFNFSVGGNYLHYETEENYYVFVNTLTLATYSWTISTGGHPYQTAPWVPGVSDNSNCIIGGFSNTNPKVPTNIGIYSQSNECMYIDPNPITNLNNQGHNYFLSQNPYNLNSYALFGETYYNIFNDLKLTGGLRWTEDQKHFTDIPSELFVHGYGYPISGVVNQQWDQFTGRAAVNWTPKIDFTEQTLIYGSYGHGYKAGGANPPGAVLLTFTSGDITNPIHPLTFKPEFIDAFELGTKNTLLDGTLTLNASAFYYNYENYQISEIVDRTAINLNFDAHVKGAEIEAAYEPIPGLRFNFAGGWEDTALAKGSKAVDLMDRTAGQPGWIVVKPFPTQASNCILPTYVVATLLLPFNPGPAGVPGACANAYSDHLDPYTGQTYQYGVDHGLYPETVIGENTGQNGLSVSYPGFDPSTAPNNGAGFDKNLSGNELPNAPPFTVSAGAQYTMPLTTDWAGTLRADYYWQDYSWARVFNDNPYDRLRGYTNVNLTLIFTSQNGWQVMLYDKNIFNTTDITGAFLNSDDSGLTTNVFLTDPKLIGIRVTKNW